MARTLLQKIGCAAKVCTLALILAGYGNREKTDYQNNIHFPDFIRESVNWSPEIVSRTLRYAADNYEKVGKLLSASAQIQVELIKGNEGHSKYCEMNNKDSRNLEICSV
jgi:hypothetical protein